MGSGHRHNTNSQKGNPQPSPNYGGGHTGCGKYRHGGIYSHGFRLKKRSHREFMEGKRVEYIGSHKDFIRSAYFKPFGTVVSRDVGGMQRAPRSMIRVKFEDGRQTYIYKKCLILC